MCVCVVVSCAVVWLCAVAHFFMCFELVGCAVVWLRVVRFLCIVFVLL